MNDRQYNSAQFARLAPDQARKIHWASLEVLERYGARLHHQEAVDLLKKGGADVSDGNLVRIPSGLVEKAFSTAPQRVVLHNRHGEPVMPLEGNRCFYGPGSDCMNIIDHRTGERRKPALTDVVEGTTVCDALPNIDFVMSMVLPGDVDQAAAAGYLCQYHLDISLRYAIMGWAPRMGTGETQARSAVGKQPIPTFAQGRITKERSNHGY